MILAQRHPKHKELNPPFQAALLVLSSRMSDTLVRIQQLLRIKYSLPTFLVMENPSSATVTHLRVLFSSCGSQGLVSP